MISTGHTIKVGPFVAGMPASVPLWVAKTLKRRNFAEIELPDWLSVNVLTSVLAEERESSLLSRRLPFYYYEIARALDCCLSENTSSVDVGGGMISGNGGGGGKAVKLVLQDVISVRSDKLRKHFHELSEMTLVNLPEGYNDVDEDGNYFFDGDNGSPESTKKRVGTLDLISVTGICSYELNKVGPFLKRTFSDYQFLVKRPPSSSSDAENNRRKASSNIASSRDYSRHDKENYGDFNEADGGGSTVRGEDNESSTITGSRKMLGRSRLRRFRS